MSSRILPPRLHHAGRLATWVLAALSVVACFIIVWVGVRGALAYEHLTRVEASVSDVSAEFAADPSLAGPALENIATEARGAHELTSDGIWSLAERTPWLGPQLSAFRTIAASSDQLLTDALLPLAAVAQDISLDDLRPSGGRFDTASFVELEPTAQRAADASGRAASAVQSLDRTPLIGSVGSAVDRADALFTRSSAAIDALARATKLLPAMLGDDGPRSYLVLVQNNAEWRSLGGITGTAILLRTDGGVISLIDTRSATELSRGIRAPAAQLPDDVREIYGSRPARFFHNLTEIPDFSVDGSLAKEMYREQTGVDVDGVIAIDPVTLSYLLKATGPVALPDGESLTSSSAVSVLLNDVYQRYPEPAAQDAFFAGATGAVFSALLDGRGSATGLVTALARATEERRILLWSADPTQRALIDGTTLAGAIPTTDSDTARFGVYLNDGTGSKMSFYVRPIVTLTWGPCSAQDRQLTVTMTLTNTAPTDAATSLPKYVTGNGAFGTAPGAATVVSNIFLPEGWRLASATTTSGTGPTEGSFDGRDVLTFGSTLGPQATDTVVITVESDSGASEAEALITPTADASLPTAVQARCISSSSATLG